MAAGGNFSLVPNEVIEIEPTYNNVITQSESMKKEFLNLSSTPLLQYKIKFSALTTANKDVLLAHYKDQSGGYYEFSWTSVPSYINSGANISGRWVDGSLSISAVAGKYWACGITFEKDN